MTEYTNVICGIGLPDDDRKKQEKDSIDITIGIFFDGTCNNKYNIASKLGTTMEKKYRDEASYHGTFTNVANLYEAYSAKQEEYQAKIYVEGIGTEEPVEDDRGHLVSSGKEDVQSGYAFGKGYTGINGKIERGCKLIVDKISKIKKLIQADEVTIGKLTLDVFGFSRGAAAARSFVCRIERESEDGISDADGEAMISSTARGGYYDAEMVKEIRTAMKKTISEGRKVNLRRFLSDAGIKIETIETRFLGLFDTVSSFAPGSFIDMSFGNDTRELGLDIPETVKAVVHLVAADEYRENFALTDTSSCPKALEQILPGAHSDIGGGYEQIEEEVLWDEHHDQSITYSLSGPYPEESELSRKMYTNMYKGAFVRYLTMKELKDGGWYMPKSETHNGKTYERYINKRFVYNTYAKIPLDLMGTLTKEKSGIPYDKEMYDSSIGLNPKDDLALVRLKPLIMEMISKGNTLDIILI